MYWNSNKNNKNITTVLIEILEYLFNFSIKAKKNKAQYS